MTVAVIVGARPQFVKAAPLLAAFANAGTARVTLIHSGQHSDANMSRVFFEELGLPAPDHQIVTPPGPQGRMTGHMLAEIEACLERERVDRVVVVGDTNTTLAGALAAVKLGITCAHVEAGLRSGNRSMPEEINRILVDQCSAVLFCPTQQAVRNLAAEGLTQGVFLVGDVMFDAIRRFRPLADQRSGLLADFGLQPRGYYVLTVHRAGNTEDAHTLQRILDACGQLEAPVLFPVHPRTRHLLVDVSVPASVRVIEPLGYLDMMSAVSQARAVLTDSGGLQKEAYFLNVPCVTLREETEWGETLAAGANVLAGTETARIVSAVKQVAGVVLPPADPRGEFGDGHAADAICRLILGGR
jgi:UDP-GlcNAc3NAcA epimerase